VGKTMAAGAVAAAARPARRRCRGGHHRRVPAAQRGARGAGTDEPQGVPGVLRPGRARGVPRRAGRGSDDLTAPVYDHLASDVLVGPAGRAARRCWCSKG
jgi:hypothetical protein